MTKKKKYIYNILILLSFIVLALVSSVFLFHTHYLFGAGDMQFHLKRIAELEASFKHGDLLPSFSFNQFHGSAVLTLYPYLNLLPIVLLSLFIKSNITLIYVSFGFNIFLSLIVSYYSSLSLSKSKQTSILFAITYSLSIPFLAYGFYNMDLGVLTSISVFPLVIFGFLSLIKSNKWMVLTFGLTLVIYSHILSTAIVIGCLILFLLFNYKKIVNLHFWKGVIKAGCLVLLLTSIVWIPALKLGINNLTGIYPTDVFPPSRISVLSLLKNGVFSYITYDLGIIALIGIVLPWITYLIFYKRFNRFTKQMYWIAIIVVIACSSPIWILTNHSIFKLLRIFQFAWRFYIIPELLLCYVFSVCITKCIDNVNIKWVFMIGSVLLVIGCQFLGQGRLIHESINSPSITETYVRKNTYTQKANVHHMILPLKQFHFIYYKDPRYPYYKVTNEKQLRRLTNTYTDENTPDYYPIKALPKVNYINNNEATYDHDLTINVKHAGYNQFLFNSPKKINRLALPLLHYNGERLRVYVNHHLVHSHTNGNSLVTLDNVKKGKNVVGVRSVQIGWIIASKIILFMLGVIWIMGHFINVMFKNMNIDEKIAAGILGIILAFSLIHLFLTGQWYDTLISVLISALFYCLELGTDGPTTEILMSFYDDYVNKSIVTMANDDSIKDIYRVDGMSNAVSENELTTYFDAINLWSQKVNLYMTKGQAQNLAKQLPHFDRFKEFMKTYTKARNTGFNGLRAVNHVDEAERLMKRIK